MFPSIIVTSALALSPTKPPMPGGLLIAPQARAASAHTPSKQSPATLDISGTVGQSSTACTDKIPLPDQSARAERIGNQRTSRPIRVRKDHPPYRFRITRSRLQGPPPAAHRKRKIR